MVSECESIAGQNCYHDFKPLLRAARILLVSGPWASLCHVLTARLPGRVDPILCRGHYVRVSVGKSQGSREVLSEGLTAGHVRLQGVRVVLHPFLPCIVS